MGRTTSVDARERILDAAKERFWRFGLKKTTIDEIAADAEVGKGTVYLHFDSKEDIALAIIAQFKTSSLERQQEIAREPGTPVVQKLKAILTHPILLSHQRCAESPAAQELIWAIKPHLQTRMRPYFEHEVAVIAEVLEEGVMRGQFQVEDTLQAARTLKYMTMGMLPPYPCVASPETIETEIGRMVDLAAKGLFK